MTAQVLPQGKQYFETAAGVPAVGWKLYTTDTGTNNPRTTWLDSAQVTPNLNPIVLDARGEAVVFWSGTYRVRLEDNLGNTIWAVDGIAFLDPTATMLADLALFNNGAKGAGMIGFGPAVAYNANTVGSFLNQIFARTAAEIAAGITPTNYFVPPHTVVDVIFPQRYGLLANGNAVSAAVNSAAIQAASDLAYSIGGGCIQLPANSAATFIAIDAVPHIWESVSIRGTGQRFGTFLKKTTAVASTITDPTVRAWDGAVVGFPIAVLHFVGHNGTDNWAYADCENITCLADTASPNTATTVYGFFFRGMIGGKVKNCFTNFTQVGFFWGSGSTITSEISLNQASNCQRGFYQHFMTSTNYFANYSNKFRFAGHYLSAYYSCVYNNAADNVGAPWKVGTAEISLAYEGNGWKGGAFFGNGIETHNGSCFKFSNCLSTRFFSNLALDVSSNYTGGSDVVLWENSSNNSCVYEDNRMQTSGMTGTGARHFIYKITTELGNYQWQRNRFVAGISDNTDTSTWANISGSINETTAVIRTVGTFTPTVLGSATAGVTTYGTRNGSYERIGNTIWFRLRVTWSNMTGTGNIVVGALPFTAENTENMPLSILADSLTFAGQLAAVVRPNSTNIDLYSIATGAATASIAVDVAATLWIMGTYNIP
jgi:hypothetical protein